jgi:hypothetical protein
MPASLERRACLVVVTSLALAATPGQLAQAAPPATPANDASAEPEPTPEPEATPEPEPEPEPEPPGEPEASPEPEVETVERTDVPTGGGVAGAIVDPDDPNAGRAQSDLEGESLDTTIAGVPERLPKLQAAGWWTTFTAVALATSGGIFAGVAEVREDEAERLAYGFDLTTGRSTLYGPASAEYERLLREGNTYQWVARGFIIAGAATLVTGIALFAVDASRRRKAARSDRPDRRSDSAQRVRPAAPRMHLHLDPGPGGLSLRF